MKKLLRKVVSLLFVVALVVPGLVLSAGPTLWGKYSFETLMGENPYAINRDYNLRLQDKKEFEYFSKQFSESIRYLKKSRINHIPHKIHFIWIGPKPFPPESVHNVQSFRKYHPDWEMFFWTDSKDRPLPIPSMKRRLVQNYDFGPAAELIACSKNYGQTADLMRCMIIYNEGGIYADHDAECLRSFDALADHYDFVAAFERIQLHGGLDSYFLPAIGLFLGRPGHPIFPRMVELAKLRWDEAPLRYPSPKDAWKIVIYRTFDSFAQAAKTLQNTEGNRDLLLPVAYFYPNIAFKKAFVKKLEKAGIVYSIHGLASAWR